jgi:hypothetical protein
MFLYSRIFTWSGRGSKQNLDDPARVVAGARLD